MRGAYFSLPFPDTPSAVRGRLWPGPSDLFRCRLRRRSDRPQPRNALSVLEINVSVFSRHAFTPFFVCGRRGFAFRRFRRGLLCFILGRIVAFLVFPHRIDNLLVVVVLSIRPFSS